MASRLGQAVFPCFGCFRLCAMSLLSEGGEAGGCFVFWREAGCSNAWVDWVSEVCFVHLHAFAVEG